MASPLVGVAYRRAFEASRAFWKRLRPRKALPMLRLTWLSELGSRPGARQLRQVLQ